MSDLISRSALAEEIKSLRVTVTGLRSEKGVLAAYANEFRDAVLRIIDEQPDAERHGKIIMQQRITCAIRECSLCGEFMLSEKYKYCPNCGAKMDKEESK